MINKKILIIFAMIFVVLTFLSLSSTNVLALGISPGRTTLDFEPGLEKEIQFTLHNEGRESKTIILDVQGELASYIHIKEKYINFAKGETEKTLSYKVKLPNSLPPGVRTGALVAVEIPEISGKVIQESFIGATVAVATQLNVLVPIPGKYIETSISFSEANKDQVMNFFVSVLNKGTESIANVYAVIDILSSTNEKIATLKTNAASIKPKLGTELVAKWKASINPGKYTARVSILWDGETTYLEKTFNVGEMTLELKDVYVKNFELGEIAKFEILVDNKWGEEIKDVFAKVTMIRGSDVIAQFKSANADIPALETKNLIAYWDTAGINPGEYTSTLELNYEGKTLTHKLDTKISLNKIEFGGIGVTGAAVSPSEEKSNLSLLLIVGVIVLILINIGWFIYFKKRKKKKTEKKKVGKTSDDGDW